MALLTLSPMSTHLSVQMAMVRECSWLQPPGAGLASRWTRGQRHLASLSAAAGKKKIAPENLRYKTKRDKSQWDRECEIRGASKKNLGIEFLDTRQVRTGLRQLLFGRFTRTSTHYLRRINLMLISYMDTLFETKYAGRGGRGWGEGVCMMC